jgi:hypothetical protein
MEDPEQKELEKYLPAWAVKLDKLIDKSKSKVKPKV